MFKTASKKLSIRFRIMPVRRIPKVSIFMAVIPKKSEEKGSGIAKNGKILPNVIPLLSSYLNSVGDKNTEK